MSDVKPPSADDERIMRELVKDADPDERVLFFNHRVQSLLAALDEARTRVAELQQTVHEHCDAWQIRAEKAEARASRLEEALKRAREKALLALDNDNVPRRETERLIGVVIRTCDVALSESLGKEP